MLNPNRCNYYCIFGLNLSKLRKNVNRLLGLVCLISRIECHSSMSSKCLNLQHWRPLNGAKTLSKMIFNCMDLSKLSVLVNFKLWRHKLPTVFIHAIINNVVSQSVVNTLPGRWGEQHKWWAIKLASII
jgi:hypothetical protein